MEAKILITRAGIPSGEYDLSLRVLTKLNMESLLIKVKVERIVSGTSNGDKSKVLVSESPTPIKKSFNAFATEAGLAKAELVILSLIISEDLSTDFRQNIELRVFHIAFELPFTLSSLLFKHFLMRFFLRFLSCLAHFL